MRRKHVPVRTCVSCRNQFPKRELVRVVRSPEGRVHVDRTGKAHGRGAYLCHQRACWERALHPQRGPLGHALKGAIPAEELETLRAFMQTLPAEKTPAPEPDGEQ